jgi:hypothetical protein
MRNNPLADADVFEGLPPAEHYLDRAETLFRSLAGARIIRAGAPVTDKPVEGGGLVIDYVRDGDDQVRRLVFGFNDEGMWVEYEGLSTLASTRASA